MIDELEQRALDAIDIDALLSCLSELIEYQSVGGQETPIQLRMAQLMRELGMEIDQWEIDLPTLKQHPAYSAEIDRQQALGVVGSWGLGDGPCLVLNGHVDVVPAGDLDRWSFPPWQATIVDNRVYGRGALDMKGPLCCALAAVRAIRDAGISLPGTVLIQSVIGEEDGGSGTLATLERGHLGDAAIVLEPTELMIAPAQAGALNFRLIVPGQAAHGALRAEGISPFDKYLLLYRAIREFEAERNRSVDDPLFAPYELPFAICIGKVQSGIWASTEAESLVCEGRLGMKIGEKSMSLRQSFAELIAQAANVDPWLKEHPPQLQWWGAQFESAAIDPNHPLVTTLDQAHHAVTGQPATIQGMPYGADMRLLVNQAQIPTVLYGPGDIRRAHAPDEYISIQELRTATQTLVSCILRFIYRLSS